MSCTAPADPVRGDRVAAFPVDPASFIGWTAQLVAQSPAPQFGYRALAFFFHPGEATGRALNLMIDDRSVTLLGRNAGAVRIDMEHPEWQRIELPLDELELFGPIETIGFTGNLEGTFYIDDLRLVADESRPEIPTAVSETAAAFLPDGFALEQNFPNPFNGGTAIRFSLPSSSDVELTVFNLAGQQVATLADGFRSAGRYEVHWDGRDDSGRLLASGVYLYRLRAGQQVQSRKLLLLQ